MYIVLKKNTHIHWWGKIIVLIFNRGYYKLSDLETFLVKKIIYDNCKEHIIANILEELAVEVDEAENFISLFIDNYSEIFEYQEENTEKICISGEENMYYPFELHISLTNMCNHRCIHCYKNAGVKGESVNYRKLVCFLHSMEKKVPFLTLSGGDPITYPQIKEIIKEFGNAYQICVLSSGYDIKDDMIEVLKRASRGVYISIYSSIPSIHDKFVGVQGSYVKIMTNIERLCYAKVPVGVTTILTEKNEYDIVKLIKELCKKDIKKITIGMISNLGRARKNGLSSGNKEVLFDRIEEIRKQFEDRVDIQKTGNCECERVLSPLKCMAGSLLWCVYENGKIYPCGMCEDEKLLMGTIEEYGECLANIETYYKRISELAMMKKLDRPGIVCPFSEEL